MHEPSAAETFEIIKPAEPSHLPIWQALRRHHLPTRFSYSLAN